MTQESIIKGARRLIVLSLSTAVICAVFLVYSLLHERWLFAASDGVALIVNVFVYFRNQALLRGFRNASSVGENARPRLR